MSTQHLQEKWSPILGHQDLPEIKDSYRKAVTAQLLENQEKFLREQSAMGVSSGLLTEAPTMSAGDGGFTNSAAAEGPVAGFDPVLISLIRRSMPNLIAYDIAGVQPMSGPTGLIFAMRALYDGQDMTNNEALFDEADSGFSGNLGLPGNGATPAAGDPGLLLGVDSADTGVQDPLNSGGPDYDPVLADLGANISTGDLEEAGETGKEFRQMGFSIEKVVVEAKGRALKAQYSMELAQDLRAIHGLDAEAELANILSSDPG